MIIEEVKRRLNEEIGKLVETELDLVSTFSTPPDPNMGDIAFPCFRLAKIKKMGPPQIASWLKESLPPMEDMISKIEIKGPYLNFFINKESLAKELTSYLLKHDQDSFTQKIGEGKTVVLDYSSPNVAKPFHIGHLGTTIIGESLARIHEQLGYQVKRVNHLGDWGVQNGFQVLAWQMKGDQWKDKEPTIDELCDLYVWINSEAKENPELDLKAREIFKAIENGDKEHLKTWKLFRDITISELEKMYKVLDVKFDTFQGEAFYEPFIAPMLEKFKVKEGFLTESQGALVVDLKEYGVEAPCIVIKSDGATIYATRDLATAIWRQENYQFHKNIYVTDESQSFHFKQFFLALKKFGYSWAEDQVHVPYGRMSYRNEEGKEVGMSTRAGTMIPLKELISKMQSILDDIIKEKNPDLQDREQVAATLGINAIKYWIQSKSRENRVIFDWQEATNPQGNTGPYLNYTYARATGILSKLKTEKGLTDWNPAAVKSLDHPKETGLLIKLDQFDGVILKAHQNLEPAVISNYLIELAQEFNSFYYSQKVLTAESEASMHDRSLLVRSVQIVLKKGMSLLGMNTVDQM